MEMFPVLAVNNKLLEGASAYLISGVYVRLNVQNYLSGKTMSSSN